MAKMRVYQLSKELGIDNREILELLEKLEVPVKSHSSSLEEADVDRVRYAVMRTKPHEVVEERVQPTIIRRRVRKVEPEPVPEKAEEAPAVEDVSAEPEPEEKAEAAPAEEAETPAAVEPETPKEEASAAVAEKPETESEKAKPAAEEKKKGKTYPPKHLRQGEAIPFTRGKKKKGPPVRGRRGRRPQRDRVAIEYRKKGKAEVRRRPQSTKITVPKAIKRKIKIEETISIQELAKRMSVKASELIRKLFSMGMAVTLNESLDLDSASLAASEFDYEVEKAGMREETVLKAAEDIDEDLKSRAPVVTVMGHVNHGKTLLLDTIRDTNVVAREAGGITQHIGASTIDLNGDRIVFLDTPGHEAFTALRARGALITDIVILIVAADDGLMPQTMEAIDHAKAAGVPIIVAINKIDLPTANIEKVRQQLAEHELVSEEWGGDTIFAEISAKEGTGIDSLLEMISLQAEMMELKSNSDKAARGVVIEARMSRKLGAIATVLVQEGTLKVGDAFVSGTCFGRIRAMTDDKGKTLKSAGPSTPIEVVGFSGVPEAGKEFVVVKAEKDAKTIAANREQKARESKLSTPDRVTLEDIFANMEAGEVKELNVVIKADVQGSIEAIRDSLGRLNTDKVKTNIILSGVGGITESDVMLAAASEAIVLGFNVRPEPKARKAAEAEGIEIKLYSIIYDAISDVKDAMLGILDPTYKEVVQGRGEVVQLFKVAKLGVIAGMRWDEGKVERSSKVRVVRDSVVVYSGDIDTLRRYKDDVKEVQAGLECGIHIEKFNDIKEGDILESFFMEEVAPTLNAGAE
ncbi:translation initiation factor IF-2 [Thermodesulfobacteriota bacterium]